MKDGEMPDDVKSLAILAKLCAEMLEHMANGTGNDQADSAKLLSQALNIVACATTMLSKYPKLAGPDCPAMYGHTLGLGRELVDLATSATNEVDATDDVVEKKFAELRRAARKGGEA